MIVKPSYIVPGPKPALQLKRLEKGTDRADVLFFGESPGRTEYEQGRAFVGPAGMLVRTVIEAELPDKLVILDNVCPEWLHGSKPNNAKLRKFATYRAEALQRYNPRVIVLLGEHAFKAFSILRRPLAANGEVTISDGRLVVLSVHPAYILRRGGNIPGTTLKLKEVFASIKACLKRPRRVSTPLLGRRETQKFLASTRDDLCSFDIETDSLDPKEGQVLCVSITPIGGKTVWLPLHHKENKTWGLRTADLLDWWPVGPRVCHNVKFELAWMRSLARQSKHGIYLDPEKLYDTMVQAWIVDENQPKGLKWQTLHNLGARPYWLGIPKNPALVANVPLNVLGEYCGQDSYWTMRLYQKQRKQMSAAQRNIADGIMIPLAKVLVGMEHDGIQVDRVKLARVTRSTKAQCTRLRNKIKKTWPDLNVRSTVQLAKLLYTDLGLPIIARTKKGSPKTDMETIDKLQAMQPIPKHKTGALGLATLVNLKKAESLLSRILFSWPDLIDGDGRIHTNFGLGTTITGRLSSSAPNLQNTARDGVERSLIVSRYRGGKIIQLDYSQHELRVLAATAGEVTMLRAFHRGEDIHDRTRKELGRVMGSIDRVKAKAANFSAVYGGTEQGLYEKYGIPLADGKRLIQGWYTTYAFIKKLHEVYEDQLRKRGYVESIFGWRRHLPTRPNKHEIRQAYNQPIQNAAAVITYMAMIDVYRTLLRDRMKTVLVLNIHDSIVLDAPSREVKRAVKIGKEAMLGVDYASFTADRLRYVIPLAVDVKIGDHL